MEGLGPLKYAFFAVFAVLLVGNTLTPAIADGLAWLLTSLFCLYDAYIHLWIKDDGAVLVVQLILCSVVGSLYVVLLNYHIKFIQKREEREHPTDTFDLRTFTSIFEQFVDMDLLLRMCYQERLLLQPQIERIRNKSSRNMRVVYLIDTVIKKGHRGPLKLIECLEKTSDDHLGHEQIAQEIKAYLATGRGFTTIPPLQELQQGITDREQEIERLRAENQGLTQQLESQRKELKEQREELEEQQKELKEQREELEEQRKELKEQHEEMESEQKELKEQREELEEQRKELKEQREEMESEQKELKEQREELESQQKEQHEELERECENSRNKDDIIETLKGART